jgi:ribosome biogenesis GTPase
MSARRRKKTREQDLTGRYLAGDLDEDQVDSSQRFSERSKNAQQEKILRTSLMRAAEEEQGGAETQIESLPLGQVIQVHSLFCDVLHEGKTYRCVTRKTLNKISQTAIVVGDRVRFRLARALNARIEAEGVIEQALERDTILTRADSFKAIEQHPIVANADQMLIVVSLFRPRVKWGLVDRMIIAAQGGGLHPVVCLNKMDLLKEQPEEPLREGAAEEEPGLDEAREARPEQVLAHYQSLGLTVLRTSAERRMGLDELQGVLKDRTTVLAGHSGVGKSSLINAIEPGLDLRTAAISNFNEKGRHTTTSARRYPLSFGGAVIDTPGVKLFGLWGVTRENLAEFFPDVEAGTAPAWRVESFERIEASLV